MMEKAVFLLAAVLALTNAAAISPSQMQKHMGLGINLGNRLDLYQQPAREVKESFIEAYANKGFNTFETGFTLRMERNPR